jgi:hypothetical protein
MSEERGERRLELGELFDTVGKALAALAGLAVFVYVIGGLTVLARLERLELPAEAVVPEIPRERLALLGLAQLLWTLVLGGTIAALALWLIPAREPGESWRTWLGRLPRQGKRKWIPALALLAVIVLIAPWSVNGLIYLAALLLGVAWFIAKGRDRPVIGVVLALALAGGVTVLRELEFPARFTRAEVTLTRESAPLFPEARRGAGSERVIETAAARVIETTDDQVLIGYESPGQAEQETATGARLPPALLVIPRESVARLFYEVPEDPASHSNSLAQEVLGVSPTPLPLMCLIPSCEWDDTGDVEHDEPAWSAPFVF